MEYPRGTLPPRRYMRHGMLTQLLAFEAVARLGSATQAAQSLCIAQPTLSGHLRKLAETLDVRLFEKQGKYLVPTAAAQAVLPAVHEVLAAFERCESELTELRAAEHSARVNAGARGSLMHWAAANA